MMTRSWGSRRAPRWRRASGPGPMWSASRDKLLGRSPGGHCHRPQDVYRADEAGPVRPGGPHRQADAGRAGGYAPGLPGPGLRGQNGSHPGHAGGEARGPGAGGPGPDGRLAGRFGDRCTFAAAPDHGEVGGGSLPGVPLPTWVVELPPTGLPSLRWRRPSVPGRLPSWAG